jgi:PPOX class probable F420-dependent enzyme
MALDPTDFGAPIRTFVNERHLATLTTLRPDGTPHVVPVGFTWDDEAHLARVICSAGSVKARNAAAGGRVVLCQVDGRRWLTLEGRVAVRDDAASVKDAERRYAERYRTPRPNPERIVLEIMVDAAMGSSSLATPAPKAPVDEPCIMDDLR